LDIFCTLTQLYLLYTKQLLPATCYCNDHCAVAFYHFLLDSNFIAETTLIVTSLHLSLHHAEQH